jgi:AcrR family transcriptional regulator
VAAPEPPEDSEAERFEREAFAELTAELALARLPSGRHGLPRSFVIHNQRSRIVAAMLRVLPRYGYPATTIGHLTAEAGVSRASFYDQFASKEQCFLATYDLAARWLCDGVERAIAPDDEWVARIRTGTSEILRLLAANPTVAHLLAVEASQAGPSARKRQRAFLRRLAEALRAGRPELPELPAELEDLLLGGALSVVVRYVDSGRVEDLREATGEIVRCLLIPYLGPGEVDRMAA